jgi:Zn ribbon nucleic-acid-binding protein
MGAICAYCLKETDKPVLLMNLSEHIEWDSCLKCAFLEDKKIKDLSLIRHRAFQKKLDEY